MEKSKSRPQLVLEYRLRRQHFVNMTTPLRAAKKPKLEPLKVHVFEIGPRLTEYDDPVAVDKALRALRIRADADPRTQLMKAERPTVQLRLSDPCSAELLRLVCDTPPTGVFRVDTQDMRTVRAFASFFGNDSLDLEQTSKLWIVCNRMKMHAAACELAYLILKQGLENTVNRSTAYGELDVAVVTGLVTGTSLGYPSCRDLSALAMGYLNRCPCSRCSRHIDDANCRMRLVHTMPLDSMLWAVSSMPADGETRTHRVLAKVSAGGSKFVSHVVHVTGPAGSSEDCQVRVKIDRDRGCGWILCESCRPIRVGIGASEFRDCISNSSNSPLGRSMSFPFSLTGRSDLGHDGGMNVRFNLTIEGGSKQYDVLLCHALEAGCAHSVVEIWRFYVSLSINLPHLSHQIDLLIQEAILPQVALQFANVFVTALTYAELKQLLLRDDIKTRSELELLVRFEHWCDDVGNEPDALCRLLEFFRPDWIPYNDLVGLPMFQEAKKTTAGACFLRRALLTQIQGANDSVPTCPISLDVMTDPVNASDGHVYERSAITK
jgi:hypothetical protein